MFANYTFTEAKDIAGEDNSLHNRLGFPRSSTYVEGLLSWENSKFSACNLRKLHCSLN